MSIIRYSPEYQRDPVEMILTIEDLESLALASREPAQPHSVFRAAEAACQRALGHKLFTVMRFYPQTCELERVFSSVPSTYPAGGRKSKRGLPWTTHVLEEGEPYVGRSLDDLKWAFDDWEKLKNLGLGSVVNTPVRYDGRCLGTMNLLHQEGWFKPEDAKLTSVISAFLVPALL